MTTIPPYPQSIFGADNSDIPNEQRDWLWGKLREAMQHAQHIGPCMPKKIVATNAPQKCLCGLDALRKAISEARK